MSDNQKEIREVLYDLIQIWSEPGRGVKLLEVNAGFQFRSAERCAPYIREMLKAKPMRISNAALETLAIVAYRQPITRAEINVIRGVDVGGVLRVLLDRKLLRIIGKREEPGRPLIYGTTRTFLELFNLRSLKEMPTLQEFQELTEEHNSKVKAEYGRKEEIEISVEEEEADLFVVPDKHADDSKVAHDLELAAASLETAVREADETVKEVLERKPWDEEDEEEPGEPVAQAEIIATPEGDSDIEIIEPKPAKVEQDQLMGEGPDSDEHFVEPVHVEKSSDDEDSEENS